MKRFRNLFVPVSMLVMFLGLAATGMRAQSLSSTQFVGKFTLPFAAEWGHMSLPPGDYNLYYGHMSTSGINIVEVADPETGVSNGFSLVRGRDDAKGEGSFLVCVFEGDKGYVRSLQMAEIGESVEFPKPHGVSVAAWIVAGNENHNTNTRLAEMRIPVVPVK